MFASESLKKRTALSLSLSFSFGGLTLVCEGVELSPGNVINLRGSC